MRMKFITQGNLLNALQVPKYEGNPSYTQETHPMYKRMYTYSGLTFLYSKKFFCCTETSTALQTNYTPRGKKKRERERNNTVPSTTASKRKKYLEIKKKKDLTDTD